jgi:hypothetical protein
LRRARVGIRPKARVAVARRVFSVKF